MSGGDPLDPGVDLEIAGSHQGADALAQHLDAGAGHGVDARVAQRRQRAVEPEAAAIGEVSHVLRPVGVQVHARGRGLHGAGDGEIRLGLFVRGQQALHAELGRAEIPRIRRDRADILERELRRVVSRRSRGIRSR